MLASGLAVAPEEAAVDSDWVDAETTTLGSLSPEVEVAFSSFSFLVALLESLLVEALFSLFFLIDFLEATATE